MKKIILILSVTGMFVSCKKETLPQIENANDDSQKMAQGITVIDDITVIAGIDGYITSYDFIYNGGKLQKITHVNNNFLERTQTNFFNSNGGLQKFEIYEPSGHTYEYYCTYNSGNRLSSIKSSPTQLTKNSMHDFKYQNGRLISYNQGIHEGGSVNPTGGGPKVYINNQINLQYNSEGDVIQRKRTENWTLSNNFFPLYGKIVNNTVFTYLQYANPFKTINHPLKDNYALDLFGFTYTSYPSTMICPQSNHFPDTETINGKLTYRYKVLESQGNLPTVYTQTNYYNNPLGVIDTIKIKYTQL
jgi:hypothetical protein